MAQPPWLGLTRALRFNLDNGKPHRHIAHTRYGRTTAFVFAALGGSTATEPSAEGVLYTLGA